LLVASCYVCGRYGVLNTRNTDRVKK